MHNIGRTVSEMNELHEFENEFENQEFGHEFEGEFGHEFEGEYQGEYEGEYEMNEALEMEMATRLLGVQSEQELEQFLGSLIRRAGRGISNFAKSSAGQALGGVLKSVAKKALPIAGAALGGMVGGPIGAKLGSSLAGMAGKAFGLELEGLSAEDREFEISRGYVRFANNAARRTASFARRGVNPRIAVRQGVSVAAQRYAPGLLAPNYGGNNSFINQSLQDIDAGNDYSTNNMGQDSGTWVRRGNSIILYNV